MECPVEAKIEQRKSIAELRTWVSYDRETGIFTRLKAGGTRGELVGQPTGSLSGKYVRIWIDGLSYYAHILAWAFVNDEWPAALVDHRNKNDQDNRYTNLRAATKVQNACNSRKKPGVGLKGTTPTRNGKRWTAQIKVNYRNINLGVFDTVEAAHDAYCAAAARHHGEFASAT